MKKSTQVAIGGLSSAICLLMMFMTGLIPFSSYIFPSLAGVVLIAVAQENGAKTAVLVFCVTSMLALMIVPDREAVILFIMLLGYYPMLKPRFERLPRILGLLCKVLLFNVAIYLFYLVMKHVFMIPDMLEGWGDFGRYSILFILGVANFTFFMYDFLLSQILLIYSSWFRPKILQKLL